MWKSINLRSVFSNIHEIRELNVAKNQWIGHPGFFVVCPPKGVPSCMACPDKTEFDPQCRTCVHPEQRSQKKSKSRFLATFNTLISCLLESADLK